MLFKNQFWRIRSEKTSPYLSGHPALAEFQLWCVYGRIPLCHLQLWPGSPSSVCKMMIRLWRLLNVVIWNHTVSVFSFPEPPSSRNGSMCRTLWSGALTRAAFLSHWGLWRGQILVFLPRFEGSHNSTLSQDRFDSLTANRPAPDGFATSVTAGNYRHFGDIRGRFKTMQRWI